MSDLSPRARRIFLASGLGLLLGIVIACLSEERTSSAIVRGDFPAFYTLAYTVSTSDPTLLYDEQHQHRLQNELWPSFGGSFLPAAYPPYLAKMIEPLALLSPDTARIVWVTAMVCIAVVAIVLLSRVSPRLKGYEWETIIGAFLFAPFLLGVVGGQIVSVSLLLYVLLFALHQRPRTRVVDFLMGVVAGCWLVKPHFSLLALALLALQHRWVALVGWGVMASMFWGVGASVLGFSWVSTWIAFVDRFTGMDLTSNAVQMTGIGAQVYLLLTRTGAESVAYTRVWSAFTAVLGALAVVGLWISERYAKRCLSENSTFSLMMVAPLVVLCLPLVNFYDLGLFVVPLYIAARPTERRHLVVGAMIVVFGLGCLAVSSRGLPGAYFALSLVLALLVTGAARAECRSALS